MEETSHKGQLKRDLPDKLLINAALEGDQTAYSLLVQRYKEGLTLYVNELVANLKNSEGIIELAEEPQDIVQEAFHKAFQSLDTYSPQYRFSTWLFNIAKNTAIDYARKRKISIGANLSQENLHGLANIGAGIKNSPEDKLISSQEYNTLIGMINSLDEKYRQPAILRFIKEYEYNEIAQELNLELNTVKTRLKRAKELLKKMNSL
ncbi:MAG: sigma-70 family RNA polymerase sigma factor [Bacteroidales bacterium]|nr:sigma-70 family RNA polymerase sigma factor [Bacteroidales bacterium]